MLLFVLCFFTSWKIMIPKDIKIIELPIKIAQLIKNSCGRIFIISSACVNCQLSFPGKKIWWNTTNAFSKSIAIISASTPATIKIDIAEIKLTPIPKGRQNSIFFFLASIKSVISMAELIKSTIRLRLKSDLQSAKCALPSCV